MKTAAAGQPQLQSRKRLIAGVLKLIESLDADDRLRLGHKLHGNLLASDGVAGAERGRAAACAIGRDGE